jgi:hypothetical protein
LLKATPYPGDAADSRPFSYDFSEALMMGLPVADTDAHISRAKEMGRLLKPLVPYLPFDWGKKGRHENALHIFLPDFMTTWVYLNLDVTVHDYKFWMGHELDHGLAPELTGDEAEDFADAFAGALLFPEALS